jgi:hypothetical protein
MDLGGGGLAPGIHDVHDLLLAAAQRLGRGLAHTCSIISIPALSQEQNAKFLAGHARGPLSREAATAMSSADCCRRFAAQRFFLTQFPWADAHGYLLPPLRGSREKAAS